MIRDGGYIVIPDDKTHKGPQDDSMTDRNILSKHNE